MERRRVSRQRFFALHKACIPALFQVGLWLTENHAYAEQTAAQAFLETMRAPALQNDARDFSAEAFRRLLALCRKARADEPFEQDFPLPAPLQALSYNRRELAVLAALGKPAAEIARIRSHPLCLTLWQLRLLPYAVDAAWLADSQEAGYAGSALF